MKESHLQIQCVDYISAIAVRHEDLLFFSIPNEGIMSVLMSFKIPSAISARIVNHFKKLGLLPGCPDFCILHSGNMFFIEFKKQGEKPNDKQLRIHDKINKCGFTVYVVDCFEDFKSILRDEGIE